MEFQPVQLPPTSWVNTEALMSHLGIKSQVTITKLIREGLPAHKIGKGYRFDLIEVDEWIRSRCITNTPGQTA